MKFQLITLNGFAYDDEANAVTLPTRDGDITVLGSHEPLMSALKPGVITIRKNASDSENKLEHYATYGGVVEVTSDSVRVLVDEADDASEINEQEAKRAQEAAQKMLDGAKTQVDLEHAQAVVDRHAVRLQVAELRRRHTRQR
ncbi:MAG: ATP synthase F1 subunit epsilon [Candidatus Saccharimonadales bacterium]